MAGRVGVGVHVPLVGFVQPQSDGVHIRMWSTQMTDGQTKKTTKNKTKQNQGLPAQAGGASWPAQDQRHREVWAHDPLDRQSYNDVLAGIASPLHLGFRSIDHLIA